MTVPSLAARRGVPDAVVIDKLRSSQVADRADELVRGTLAHILAHHGRDEFRRRAAASITRIAAAVYSEMGQDATVSMLMGVISSLPT